jgi:hypothetical protein
LREMVHRLFEQHGNWWEPGFARTVLDGVTRPLVPVFFRIFIEQITGHRASLEIDRSSTETSPAKTAGRWWRRLGRGPRRSRPLLLHRLEQAQKILDPHANLSLVNRTTEPFPSLKLEPLAPHRHFTILSMSRDLLASIDQPG